MTIGFVSIIVMDSFRVYLVGSTGLLAFSFWAIQARRRKRLDSKQNCRRRRSRSDPVKKVGRSESSTTGTSWYQWSGCRCLPLVGTSTRRWDDDDDDDDVCLLQVTASPPTIVLSNSRRKHSVETEALDLSGRGLQTIPETVLEMGVSLHL